MSSSNPNEIKKTGSYKPKVKAKLNSHLLLKEEDRSKLKYLLDIENGLNINSDDVRYKWVIQHSTKTLIVKQSIDRDLLSSWCFNRWMNAIKALEIPLEKLPTTNNYLEGINEYLKNNQLNRFQRNNHFLKADAERRKDLNIIDPSDRKIIMQEFFQVDELSEKIYIEVESKTMSGLIYTTCVYRQPTDICCQCFDFLQRETICKHLRAAALYIKDL
ncbi:6224_t:CDS:2, partial [Racocetra persica]